MSILGAVVRLKPEHLSEVLPRLAALPGVEVSLNPGDGRLVLVLEDVVLDGTRHDAAAHLAAIALWPGVLNTSLVYEYSGPDAPAADGAAVNDYRAWRGSLKDWAEGQPPPGAAAT
jgi:nitrate reductase NapAB chaperone NapD